MYRYKTQKYIHNNSIKSGMLRNLIVVLLLSCISCKDRKANTAYDAVDKNSAGLSKVYTKTKTDSIVNQAGKIKTDRVNKFIFDIEGTYTFKDEPSKCDLTITIFKADGDYKYKLITTERNLSGGISLELNERKDGYYINFKGIEWSEYEGAIEADENENEVEKEVELPTDLNGLIYEGEITIQNSGNAMNYYVKLAECDVKYIHLKKELKTTNNK